MATAATAALVIAMPPTLTKVEVTANVREETEDAKEGTMMTGMGMERMEKLIGGGGTGEGTEMMATGIEGTTGTAATIGEAGIMMTIAKEMVTERTAVASAAETGVIRGMIGRAVTEGTQETVTTTTTGSRLRGESPKEMYRH